MEMQSKRMSKFAKHAITHVEHCSSKVNREWFISCRAKARRVCLFMCSRLDLETSSVGATKVTRGHCNPLHPPRLKKNHVFLFLEASNSASASLAFFKEDFGSQVALSNG